MLLDLAQRHGCDRRDPVVPGERMKVAIELRHAAHSFAAGHRLRVAISGTYWPIVWPMPAPVALQVFACAIELPVRPADPRDAALAPFAPPECAAADAVEESAPFAVVTRLHVEPDAAAVVRSTHIDLDAEAQPVRTAFTSLDWESGHGIEEWLRIAPHDPLAAEIEIRHHTVQRRGDWEARADLQLRVRAGADAFDVQAELRAEEDGTCVRERRWRERVPRP
jgi:hypothetical protein